MRNPQTLKENDNEPQKDPKITFWITGVAVTAKMASCTRVLKTMGMFLKQSHKIPLYGSHHQWRIEWDQENLKIDFSKIIFTNEVKTRPQTLADLNPKEILLAILKHKIYKNVRHFWSKETLLKVIQEAPKVIRQGKLIAVAYSLRTYWNQFSLGGVCKQE